MKAIKAITVFTLILTLVLALTSCGVRIIVSYPNADAYLTGGEDGTTVIDAEVSSVEISWPVGVVRVVAGDVEAPTLVEDGEDAPLLKYLITGGLLKIQYAEPGIYRDIKGKELTLTLPVGVSLGEFSVDGTSTEVSANGIEADDIEISCTSGRIELTDCKTPGELECTNTSGEIRITGGSARDIELTNTSGDISLEGALANEISLCSTSGSVSANILGDVKEITCDSTSGDVSVVASGTVEKLSFDSTSGNIRIEAGGAKQIATDSTSGDVSVKLNGIPENIGIDTVSGSVTLTLPEGSFGIRVDTVSGDVDIEHSSVKKGSTYIVGEGGPIYEIDTVSGDINVNKR